MAKFMDEVTRLSAQKYFWRDKAKASVAQAEKALDAAHKHAPILRAPQTLSTSCSRWVNAAACGSVCLP